MLDAERKTGREQHAVGDFARELEHLRSGRCDVDRISSPLVEHHLGAAQLVQLALVVTWLARPQRAQVLDVIPHDPDRFHRLDAGFGEIEDIADRYA